MALQKDRQLHKDAGSICRIDYPDQSWIIGKPLKPVNGDKF
ncbi:hypothetical protein ABU162_21755 [Paenibacillus thiaminolyticus]